MINEKIRLVLISIGLFNVLEKFSELLRIESISNKFALVNLVDEQNITENFGIYNETIENLTRCDIIIINVELGERMDSNEKERKNN